MCNSNLFPGCGTVIISYVDKPGKYKAKIILEFNSNKEEAIEARLELAKILLRMEGSKHRSVEDRTDQALGVRKPPRNKRS